MYILTEIEKCQIIAKGTREFCHSYSTHNPGLYLLEGEGERLLIRRHNYHSEEFPDWARVLDMRRNQLFAGTPTEALEFLETLPGNQYWWESTLQLPGIAEWAHNKLPILRFEGVTYPKWLREVINEKTP